MEVGLARIKAWASVLVNSRPPYMYGSKGLVEVYSAMMARALPCVKSYITPDLCTHTHAHIALQMSRRELLEH